MFACSALLILLLTLQPCTANSINSTQDIFAPARAAEIGTCNVGVTPKYGNLRKLFSRQSCPSGSGYCSSYGICCPLGQTCCPGGCAPYAPANVNCCGNGKYCFSTQQCCENSCIPLNSQCCSGGAYCPSPFICVKLGTTGQIVCCTDLTCKVYLAGGQTYTSSAAPSTTVQPATSTTSRSSTIPTTSTTSRSSTIPTTSSIPPTSTMQPTTVLQPTTIIQTSTVASAVQVQYTTYTTIFLWYYWYYYYSLSSTATTRVRTTVMRTTTVTYAATGSAQAQIYFASVSSNLPTPTGAQVEIPEIATAGAIVVGSCSVTSTLSDGAVSLGCSQTIAKSAQAGAVSTGSGSAGAAVSTGGAASEGSMERIAPRFVVILMTIGLIIAVGAIML